MSNVNKLPHHTDDSIRQFIAERGFLVRRYITVSEIEPYVAVVEERDAHVIAGALITRCEYLVTLDKKHIDTRVAKNFVGDRLCVVSPQEMLSRTRC